jgi:hypothetical protein
VGTIIVGAVLMGLAAAAKVTNVILCSTCQHIRQYRRGNTLHTTSDGYFHSTMMEAIFDISAITLGAIGLIFLIVGILRRKKPGSGSQRVP